MKNNILILIPTLNSGGCETQTKILIKELIVKGFIVTLAVRKNNFDKNLSIKNLNIIELENRPGISLISIVKLRLFIKKSKPLFVYSFLRQMNVMAGFLKIVINFNWISSERSNPNFNNSIYSKLERILQKQSIVISNSKIAHEYYKSKNYNSLHITNFLKYEPQTFVSYDKKFIVLSRLIKSKKIDLIIEAWSKLNTKSNLMIVGNGPEKENLKLLSKSLSQNNVKFYDNISDPKSLLLSSSFYISSSIIEGMPNATIEALCCNNIIILSDIDVHREILNSNFKYLFKPNSVEELVVVLKRVVNLSKTDYDHELSNQRKFLNDLSNSKIIDNFLEQTKTFFQITNK